MGKMVNVEFWKNKKVFVTGHTGFKGSWLVQILKNFGAEVCGYSLEPNTTPNLFEIAKIEEGIEHNIGDVRDFDNMFKVFSEFKPEIVCFRKKEHMKDFSYGPILVYGDEGLISISEYSESL